MKIALQFALLTLLGLFTLESSQVRAEAAATPGRKLPFHGKVAAVDTSAQTITLSGKSARVFHLTSTTKITDGAGAVSSLSAATVGEDVGGSYEKDAAGTMTLVSVRFGAKVKAGEPAEAEAAPAPASAPAPKTAAAPAPALVPEAQTPAAETTPAPNAPAPPVAPATDASTSMKKQRFTGKVVSVNAAGNSLVVHGKMDLKLTATAATKITGASGASTLADATVGEKVSGSYMKAADGTMTLSTLKLGK